MNRSISGRWIVSEVRAQWRELLESQIWTDASASLAEALDDALDALEQAEAERDELRAASVDVLGPLARSLDKAKIERTEAERDAARAQLADLNKMHAGLVADYVKNQAAIQRVRDLIETVENRMMATAKPAEMRRALDGAQ